MDRIQDLLSQVRKNPNRPDLHSSLGRLYLQRGDRVAASKHFLSSARLFADRRSPSRNINKAVASLRKLIRDFPENHDSYYLLADLHLEMEDTESAIVIYRSLADIYQRDGKLLMAVSVYDKITNSDPENMDGWIKFADLNKEAGMPFHSSHSYMRAAFLSSGMGRSSEEYDLALRALKVDPENKPALELIGRLIKEGNGAKHDMEELVSLSRELDRDGHSEQALTLISMLESASGEQRFAVMAAQMRERLGKDGTPETEIAHRNKSFSGKYSGMKVLIVDDEREIILLLEQILKEEGFQVLMARDGQQGYDIFMRERPRLVVSDAMLPKLHGFELCKRIKEEAGESTRVMILTAVYKKYKYKGKVEKEYGVDEYLDKPFQITEFIDTLYRMAKAVSGKPDMKNAALDNGKNSAEGLFFLIAGDNEELLSEVSSFCDRKGCAFKAVRDAKSMISFLEGVVPDILLVTDQLRDLAPPAAAWLVERVLGIRSATRVFITGSAIPGERDSSDFHHTVSAPVNFETLNAIVRLHRGADARTGLRGKEKKIGVDGRRMEALIRSKVERVLKSQYQLEHYYTGKIQKLEDELGAIKARGKGKDTARGNGQ
ncbi:alkaline phosphatase synthesis transcriptional regulatory protein PhoP [bacterium BMS3Abin14]|nr:alkaline phosphatase synthesis transcriptional regulatory protein PhoP [bacterium BMS3Abin14]